VGSANQPRRFPNMDVDGSLEALAPPQSGLSRRPPWTAVDAACLPMAAMVQGPRLTFRDFRAGPGQGNPLPSPYISR